MDREDVAARRHEGETIAASPPSFRGALVKGRFLERKNRFLIECQVGRKRVAAHLPNPGRLHELLLPDVAVTLLGGQERAGRRTAFTAVAVEKDGRPVLLHTHHTNEAAHWLLDRRLVPGLDEYRVAGREVRWGKSRFDFALRRGGEELLLEVKSCTLFGRRIAMFPDAVTSRGRRHVLELASLAEGRRKAGVLFLVHWPEAEYFLPEYHTDPEFSRALLESRERLFISALALEWKDDLSLSDRVRPAVIPWRVLEREMGDRGSYLLVLHLPSPASVSAGNLGTVKFDRGWYVYAGSAERGLFREMERHRRKGKKPHRHVDFLREHGEVRALLPVCSSERLECTIAGALDGIAGRSIPRFGVSDCRCPSHLFSLGGDPLRHRPFIELLLHFRIDRLLEEGETAGLFPRPADGSVPGLSTEGKT